MIGGVASSAAASTAYGSSRGRDDAQASRRQEQDARKTEERPANDPSRPKRPDGQTMSQGEVQELRELQARDREVRAHEAAHQAAGGSLAGGASFSYQQGPDGKQYAIGGEVSIDTGREKDPQRTVSKMQRVIAAALAPAQPSAQDRSVASQAGRTMTQAQGEIGEQARAEREQASAEAAAQAEAKAAAEAQSKQADETDATAAPALPLPSAAAVQATRPQSPPLGGDRIPPSLAPPAPPAPPEPPPSRAARVYGLPQGGDATGTLISLVA